MFYMFAGDGLIQTFGITTYTNGTIPTATAAWKTSFPSGIVIDSTAVTSARHVGAQDPGVGEAIIPGSPDIVRKFVVIESLRPCLV